MDQSGLMAGKSNVQTRRSVLGSVNTNTVTNTNEVRDNTMCYMILKLYISSQMLNLLLMVSEI